MTMLWRDDTTDLFDLELSEWEYRERYKPPQEKKRKSGSGSRLGRLFWILVLLVAGTYFWVSFISEAHR